MKLPSPENLLDFHRMFPTEEACVKYLFSLRWPDGNPCPENCGGEYALYEGGRVINCKTCRKNISLTAGTIFHKSHTDMLTWFHAAYLVSTLTPGISAVQLQHQLGINRYETAFQMLHKLRAAMVNPEREKLHGVVEVDETLIGGTVPGGKGGRSTEHKTLVIGAVEQIHAPGGRRGVRAGRLRLRVVESAVKKHLTEFVEDHIGKGAIVLTDGWEGYNLLRQRGYDHRPTVEGQGQNAAHILPLIHLEFSNLKTWLQGTHHGRQERQHLQAYLNEFAFRHNRRFWRFSAFQTLLRLAMHLPPQEYRDLYDADEYGKAVHVGESLGGYLLRNRWGVAE